MKEIKWKDLKIGDVMSDGSSVTQIHSNHTCDTIKVTYKTKNGLKKCIVSSDHLFLCNINCNKRKNRKVLIEDNIGLNIPIEEDIHIWSSSRILSEEENKKIREILTNGGSEKDLPDDILITSDPVKVEPKIYNKDEMIFWLTALEINKLLKTNFVKSIKSNGCKIIDTEYLGKKECFCISTDSGKYGIDENFDGLIHHNSVAIRNIILHCLTHGISIGLVDLKLVEFSPYKGHKNVLGVANTIPEAAELLRIGRQIMYKRNAELQKAGVVQLSDYHPKKPTNIVEIFGREFQDDEMVEVRTPGSDEIRQITVKQLLEELS